LRHDLLTYRRDDHTVIGRRIARGYDEEDTRVTNPVLLVSEYFPPAIGGSAELLSNIYARMAADVTVLTTVRGPGIEAAAVQARVERMPFPHGLGMFAPSALRDMARLTRRIARLASDRTVIYCGRALPEGTAACLHSFRSGTPYAVWTHGEELPIAASSRELSWLLRRVHRRSAALIANSHNTARLLRALGNPADKIHVVHPAVDHERFQPDHQGGAALRRRLTVGGELLLLSVGRLQARKGHDLVLKALASMPASAPRMRYIVTGCGDDAPRLQALAAELGLTSQVDFIGIVPPDALPSYYAAADIFVHPNRVEGEDFEGFGMVFLEAAATGMPAIGGRSGGVPEAIEEGKTGLLVSGSDPNELCAAIIHLASSSSVRASFGSAARQRVLTYFTWARAVKQVEEIDAVIRRQLSGRRR
jgi:phosphatidyl-myo-inositol dimannoside synthase